jgi:hypothetical protein
VKDVAGEKKMLGYIAINSENDDTPIVIGTISEKGEALEVCFNEATETGRGNIRFVEEINIAKRRDIELVEANNKTELDRKLKEKAKERRAIIKAEEETEPVPSVASIPATNPHKNPESEVENNFKFDDNSLKVLRLGSNINVDLVNNDKNLREAAIAIYNARYKRKQANPSDYHRSADEKDKVSNFRQLFAAKYATDELISLLPPQTGVNIENRQ